MNGLCQCGCTSYTNISSTDDSGIPTQLATTSGSTPALAKTSEIAGELTNRTPGLLTIVATCTKPTKTQGGARVYRIVNNNLDLDSGAV